MRTHYKVHCALPLRRDIRYVIAILIYPAPILLDPLGLLGCLRLVIFGEQ